MRRLALTSSVFLASTLALLSVFAACSDDPAPAPVVDAGAPDVAEDTAPPPGSITVAVQEAVTVRRGQSTKFTATLTRGAGTGKPVTFKAKSLGQGLTMADATASGTDTTFELELKASGAAALGFGTASITYQVEGQTPKEVALRVLVTDGTSGGYDNDLGNGGYVQVVVKAGAAISGVGVVAKFHCRRGMTWSDDKPLCRDVALHDFAGISADDVVAALRAAPFPAALDSARLLAVSAVSWQRAGALARASI